MFESFKIVGISLINNIQKRSLIIDHWGILYSTKFVNDNELVILVTLDLLFK